MSRNSVERLILVVAAGAVLLYALIGGDEYAVRVLIWIAANALVAAALRFVMLVGELNIATAAFWGLGAYASAVATVQWGLPLGLAILLGGVFAAVVSAPFGYITMRTKGPYFLLISFAFTEVVRLVYTKTNAIGGNSGIVGIYPPLWLEPWFPAIIIGLIMAVLLGLYILEHSTLGTVFRAIENNDDIVRSVGVDVLMIKVLCVVIASFAAGVGGALYAHANTVISPGDFSFLLAVFALAYLKVGGQNHFMGPVVGAVLLTIVSQQLQGSGALEHVLFGLVIIFVMLAFPGGLMGLYDAVVGRFGETGKQDEPASGKQPTAEQG